MFQMSILEFVDRDGSPLFHLEHYIEGNYIKHNSNAGFVEDIQQRHTPHAFSHFSFECSNHELIIVDIQGVGDLYTGKLIKFRMQKLSSLTRILSFFVHIQFVRCDIARGIFFTNQKFFRSFRYTVVRISKFSLLIQNFLFLGIFFQIQFRDRVI